MGQGTESEASGFLNFTSESTENNMMRKKSTLEQSAIVAALSIDKMFVMHSKESGNKNDESPKFGMFGEIKIKVDLSKKEPEKENTKPEFHQHLNNNEQNLAIVSSAFTIGKSKTNEDAFFIMDRGFGVADGVSGWIDFGFSSEAFSHELMDNCKKEIEKFER